MASLSQDVGMYGHAAWAEAPPRVLARHASPSGVAAIAQHGHTLDCRSTQEVVVGAGDFDCLLFSPTLAQDVDCFVEDKALRASSKAATTIFFLAGQTTRWVCRPTSADLIHLHIPRHQRRAMLDEESGVRMARDDSIAVLANDRLSCIGRDLAEAVRVDSTIPALLLDSYAVIALHSWSNHRSPPLRGGLAPWQANRAIALIADCLAEDLPLGRLAAEVQLSPFHFARSFKQSVGVPPHRYQAILRIQTAEGLLRSTDLPVIEIAAKVGYSDPSHFAKLFKREVGIAPLRYRRERRA